MLWSVRIETQAVRYEVVHADTEIEAMQKAASRARHPQGRGDWMIDTVHLRIDPPRLEEKSDD